MELTLLKEENVWGDNALQAIRDYGTPKGMSDLAIALGTFMEDGTKDVEGVASGLTWLMSSYTNTIVRTIDSDGSKRNLIPLRRSAAGCPAISASETSLIHPNKARELTLSNGKRVQICEYGVYPQTVAPKDTSRELEIQYKKDSLKTTGKSYTFDDEKLDAYNTGFTPHNCAEYSYKGKKYVRVAAKPYADDTAMSDGTKAKKGQEYWFEVQPIEWLMDPSGIWVAKNGLFAGIQFDTKKTYDGNFAATSMKKYLQAYFAEDMQNTFTETLGRLEIRNAYFNDYVTGVGENKKFYPEGRNGIPFTPQKAEEIVNITNAAPFMRDVLKLISTFPKEEQGLFKGAVLEIFNPCRDAKPQPNEVLAWGKKLAAASGYEKELNQMLGIQNADFDTDTTRTAENGCNTAVSFFSRFGKISGGR